LFNSSESSIGLFELLAKKPRDCSKVHISIDMNFELLVFGVKQPLREDMFQFDSKNG
jgi:hypothetical protein